MGFKAQRESNYAPKLPLLSAAHARMQSPERSPWHASASVPFRWEDEPGKPKPCTALTTLSNPNDFAPKRLELPPRLLLDAKINAKLPSATAVLEGPYMGRPRFQSSSFRLASECYGSFRAGSSSPEIVQLGTLVLGRQGYKENVLGSRRRRALNARREVGGNSHVFPSSGDRASECSRGEENSNTGVKITRIRRNGSFPSLSDSNSHFWASIYEGLKQVVPWSKREKKDGFMG